MIGKLSVAFLLLAVPAFGQSRVYTNADLDKIPRTRTVTDEELAALRANQFVAVPERSGPVGVILGGSTHEGPFGPFYMPASGPLDPFYYSGNWYGGGWGRWDHYYTRGPVNVTVPNLSFPAPITVPPFARGPVPSAIAPVLPVAVPRGRRR